ncbi:MAG: hypothetical protein FJX77_10255 [Armatimonadetes bacterium]|nr:hypothetical protein [Armatimonadota bacterium]
MLALGAVGADAEHPWSGYGDPTGEEQQFLELLNQVRANPLAYQTHLGTDLTAGNKFALVPRPPLVFNARLLEAARRHSQDMNDRGFFGHQNPQGETAAQRLRAAGYAWLCYSENLAVAMETPAEALRELVVDDGIPDLGHRVSLLGLSEHSTRLDEIGIGIHLGGGPHRKYYSLELAADANPAPFVTGVAFRDSNRNGAYDPGEGLPGIQVQIGNDAATVTSASGEYALPLPEPGSYVATASGPGLGAVRQAALTMGSVNTKLDFAVQPILVAQVQVRTPISGPAAATQSPVHPRPAAAPAKARPAASEIRNRTAVAGKPGKTRVAQARPAARPVTLSRKAARPAVAPRRPARVALRRKA